MTSHAGGPSSPTLSSSSSSITTDVLASALLRSDDYGQTLDFGHLGLTDVGEYGAQELAAQGRQSLEEASTLHRWTISLQSLAALTDVL